MKKRLIFLLAVLTALVVCSCEKVYIENDDGSPEETVGAGDDSDDDGWDDDGWTADDSLTVGDSEFDVGDEVDVATFSTTPIYTQVWVSGYIVGAATGAGGRPEYDFEPPFSYDTAVLLADNPDESDLDKVISVCLTGCAKSLRARVNLKDHPENLGRRLSVFGFQDVYLDLFGIKKIDSYDLTGW